MKDLEIQFDLPWPPSINKTYVNASPHVSKKSYYINHVGKVIERKTPGRFLSKEGRSYKKLASEIAFYSSLGKKFGKRKIEVKIVQFLPDGRKRDRDNGIKIVFDSLELSGLIDNDRQIVGFEVVEGPPVEKPYWKLWIRPYQRNKEFGIFKEFLNTLPTPLEEETP